jgi:tRNA(Ile)-lysidine synthetase-like protein
MTTSSGRAREEIRRAVRAAAVRLPDLFAPGSRLVVGFSGGQDSTALLHALTHAHRGLDVLAAHVDHALRADSAEAARRVVDSAEAIGVGCVVRRVDVAAYRRNQKAASVQQAARAARYQALGSVVAEHGATALLVAHTADDQAETLLLNLLRGTGLSGLSAMRMDETLELRRLGPQLPDLSPSLARVRVARPLLRIARPTTLAYCVHFGLSIVDDASNRARTYTRNRVRLDLLPVLEHFNPAVRTVLARTADLVAEDDAALEAIVAELRAGFGSDQIGEYELRRWRDLPRAYQRRLLRIGLEEVTGDLADVADAPVEDALDLLQSGQPNQTYHLPYGVELRIGTTVFTLRPHANATE